jgi:stage V sporulation protein B
MPKQSLVYNTAVMVSAGFINRILGFLYRVLIVRLIGPEAVGLYEMVFPAFMLVLMITTSGIPVAVSIMIAEQMALGNIKQVYKIFRLALSILCLAGITFAIFLFFATPWLTYHIFPDPRVYWCFLTMTPAIWIIAVSSIFRGFFQGLQQMTPAAVSQICEQIVRVFIGLFAAARLLPYGLEYAAVGLSLGMLCGEAIGLLFLFVQYFFYKPRLPKEVATAHLSQQNILKQISQLAIPVTLTKIAAGITLTLEAILIPQRLQAAGYTLREATEIYGQFSGIALTLVHLPTIITISLAITLIPAISEAVTQKNKQLLHYRCREALRLTILTGLPCAMIFYLLPQQISSLLFNVTAAGLPLQVLAIGCVFVYLQQTTTSILQGLGQVSIALKNAFGGAVLGLIGIYFLTALPAYGIRGTAMAINTNAIVVAILNILAIIRFTKVTFNFKKIVFNPFIATFFMGFAVYLLFLKTWGITHSNLLATLTATLGGLLVYLISLYASGTIERVDILRLPLLRRFL